MRLLACIVGLLSLIAITPGARAQAVTAATLSKVVKFEIPPQKVSTALIELSHQAGIQVLMPGALVDSLQSGGVSGQMTVREAISKLLRGTNLGFHEVGTNAVGINAQPADVGQSSAVQSRNDAQVQLRLAQADQGGPQASTAAGAGLEADQPRLEEVVVTAQKREERLIDTPQSVSVVSAAALEALGATQFRDFANTVPGLDFATAGAGQTQISLRGLSTGFDIGSTIGVYVDDVPFGTSGAFAQGAQNTIDVGLFDLDRVEVLRGPQGTLYGASTMGGLLKYVTTRPNTTDFRGNSQVSVADTGDGGGVSYNVAAAANIPISAGTAGLRASVYQMHDGGFIDNVALHQKDVNRADIYGGRLDFLFTPTEALSIRIDGFLQNIARDGQSTADYALNGAPLYGNLDQFRKVQEPWEQRFRLVSGTVTYDFGLGTLTSISSYQTVRSHYVFDVSPLYVPFFPSLYSAISYPVDTGTDKVTEELRVSSKQGGVFEWLAGGFYTHESTTNVEKLQPYTLTGLSSSDNLFSFSNPSTYAEYSVFADLTWHLTTKFDVTGGLRYSHDTQAKTQYGSGLFGSAEPETSADESVVTYLTNARYHFTEHQVGYLRFATGYRPGGPNFVSLNPVTREPNGPPTFGSDHLRSYEAGYKAETDDRRLALDLAIYHIDWSNIQVSVSTGNGFSGIGNAPGGATVNGSELTLTARPTRSLTVTGAFAYQHAFLKQADASLGASEGESLPNVPHFSGSFIADYVLAENGLRPSIGATVRYVADRCSSFDGSKEFPQYHLPAYASTDLRGGVTFGSIVAQLYVHNLFDRRGELGVLYPQFGNHVAILQPRTVGISATARF